MTVDGRQSPYSAGVNDQELAQLLLSQGAVDAIGFDSGGSTQLDVRDGKPFDNGVVGHYVYHVSWTADGKELLFNRTNRRQNVLELCAADPATGKCRVLVHEEWPTGWVENSPATQWLKDNKHGDAIKAATTVSFSHDDPRKALVEEALSKIGVPSGVA